MVRNCFWEIILENRVWKNVCWKIGFELCFGKLFLEDCVGEIVLGKLSFFGKMSFFWKIAFCNIVFGKLLVFVFFSLGKQCLENCF